MARGYTPEELEIAIKAAVKVGCIEVSTRQIIDEYGIGASAAVTCALYALGVEELKLAKKSFYVNVYNGGSGSTHPNRATSDAAASYPGEAHRAHPRRIHGGPVR